MENRNYLELSQDIYNLAEPDYERYYYNQENGGFVLVHKNHNQNASELFIAKIFANQGRGVKLLSEQAEAGVRTPDAEIDGSLWEFKELTPAAASVSNAVQRGVAVGKKRDPNLAAHINTLADGREINTGISRALIWDKDMLLPKIGLVYNDEILQFLTREELDNGQGFQ